MIPIIYIQNGWFPFFEIAVRSARCYHPEAKILHIGDQPYYHLSNICDFQRNWPSHAECQKLRKHYRHLSPNTIEFERFCIERWFLVHQAMKKNHWNQCWVFDSDTILFNDFNLLAPQYSDHAITINQHSPHATLIHCQSALGDFCDWVLDLYINQAHRINEFRQDLGWGVQGISDMTLLTEFGKQHGNLGDNSLPSPLGMIDNNISMPQDMKFAAGKKEIQWIDGQPWCETRDGQLIKMNLLHFQGPAKSMMPNFAHAEEPADLGHRIKVWRTKQSFKIAKRIQRLRKSLEKRLT